MKKISSILFFVLVSFALSAQCFTIESILADACGDPEGENEMVVLRTNVGINTNNLIFDWPNNSFLNWCSNPTKTAQLNQTISSSCGLLLEPPNGFVPAGKKILVVSSVNMLVSANSFSGLTDTLYILYQCAGNTSGHFSNMSTTGRTLSVDYSGNCTGTESVSYRGADLLGGDGGAVFYDLNGDRTYYNTGCNAPVPSINPYWNIAPIICNTYDIIDLNTLLPPNASSSGTWSGAIENVHFFNPQNKLGTYSITYTADDPDNCLLSPDSTIIFEVDELKSGNDTVIVCDSINQFGVWIFEDTVVDVFINFSNPFICDSVITRYYFINKTNYSLVQNEVTLNSDESFDFEIVGAEPFSYSFTNTLGDSCALPCNVFTVSPTDNTIYSISVLNETTQCKRILDLNVIRIYFPEVNIPNTFTPNQDGENDVFKLYGKDLESINFKIFSAWGELVFEGEDLTAAWDGNFKNKPVSSGLFVVQIKALGKDKKDYSTTSKLNLLR